MALDLVSAPFPGEARPKKRPRLGWDVGPLFSDEASRLQLQLATQILSAQSLPFDQLFQHGNGTVLPSAATDLSLGTAQFSWMSGNQMAPMWREDDKDGHLQFEIGDILNSRYRVLNKMGEGTFGRVLECQDIETKEVVAVKVIRSAEKYREAAMIEVDVLHTLHDNDKTGSRGCVEIRSWFDYRNHICIVFEKLGPSLYEFLRTNNYRPFSVDLVREFGRQLLESVAYMHELRLIHTDLKPENILLVSSDYIKVTDYKNSSKHRIEMKRAPKSSEIKLIDFGSATYDREDSYSIVSTRHYRAPEVILGLGWSYPCDIWSVGCILVELCSGEALFQTHENLEHLAMMERVLGPIPSHIIKRAMRRSEKYFKHGRELYWPEGAPSRDRIRAVRRLPRLKNLVMEHADHSAGLLIDLVEQLMKYDSKERLTAREALEHPFFRAPSRR